jgi:hypothetical protein
VKEACWGVRLLSASLMPAVLLLETWTV